MCGDHAPESQSVMYRRKTGRKGVGGNWNLSIVHFSRIKSDGREYVGGGSCGGEMSEKHSIKVGSGSDW